MGGTNELAIDIAGGDLVAAVLGALTEGPIVCCKPNRVGVGGTLVATLRVVWFPLRAVGSRGIVMGNRPSSGTGGALCMTGASESEE